MKALFLKTNATCGRRQTLEAHPREVDRLPRLVELAWVYENADHVAESKDLIVEPHGFEIPFEAECIHDISTQEARQKGLRPLAVLTRFVEPLVKCDCIIGCGLSFDIQVIASEMFRLDIGNIQQLILSKPTIDISEQSTNLLKLPSFDEGYSKPSLRQIFHFLFKEEIKWENDLMADVVAIKECFWKLQSAGLIAYPGEY